MVRMPFCFSVHRRALQVTGRRASFGYAATVIVVSVFLTAPCQAQSENKRPDSAVTSGEGSKAPIDCPLRDKGVAHEHKTPFGNTEKYIDFLERQERVTWQKPGVVIETLKLKGDEKIADVGAGSGYFSLRFASALPRGRVYAIDVDPAMIDHIRHRAMADSIDNVEIILASPDDPKVPKDSEIVFICDVLHHVENKSQWLKKIHGEVKKGARLILVEYKEGDLPEGPPEWMKMSPQEVTSNALGAGFTHVSTDNDLLPYQIMFVFEKR
jgi:ubiquinone/menaquinone biosynthesis C-methylase UbiE